MQEFICLLWNPKVYYCVHKSPALPLSWVRCIQSTTSNPISLRSFWYYPALYAQIFWVVSSVQPSQPTFLNISHLLHACNMPCPSPHPWFDHPNSIWWRVQIMELLTAWFPSAFCHCIPLRSIYSPKHPVPKHPSLCFSPNMRDKVSHSCEKVKLFKFLDSRWEGKRFWTAW
jgi:hypothetical protein